MANRIKGILFDLGDTLMDFGKVDIPTLFEAGAKLTYDYLKKLELPLPTFAKYHRRQLWAIKWNYLKSRITRREFNSLDLIGKMSERMGHQLTHQHMMELAWMWYEPLSKCVKVEDGIVDLLRSFQRQGLKMGLVSNTFVPGEVLDRHLQMFGLLELLPLRVYSCEVGYRKPTRRIFQIAMEQAGLNAGETLFVGDSLKADIYGANRVGLISVLKDPAGRHVQEKILPVHTIRLLAELTEIIRQYNSV